MSYDLVLLRIPEGGDAETSYREFAAAEEADTLAGTAAAAQSPGVRDEVRRLADVLRWWRPSLQVFEPKGPAPLIQLSDEGLQMQIEVCDRAVAVSIPCFRERAQEMMNALMGCVEAVQATVPYAAYDPQLGRVVYIGDLEEMLRQYRGVDQALPEISRQQAQPGPPSAAAKKPWWKRG